MDQGDGVEPTISSIFINIVLSNVAVIVRLKPCSGSILLVLEFCFKLNWNLRIANNFSSFRPACKIHTWIRIIVDFLIRAQTVGTGFAFRIRRDLIWNIGDRKSSKHKSDQKDEKHGVLDNYF